MKWIIWGVCISVMGAVLGHAFHLTLFTFCLSATALIGLSKLLGDATEQLSLHLGQNTAGLVNVTLSNLAELIIIFAAVRSNQIELVQGGIVGSVIGNLLFVMGCSIYFGCRSQGVLRFNINTGTLFIKQFFLVGATILLPTLFAEQIPAHRHALLSQIFAAMLAGAYLYFYLASRKDERFKHIEKQTSHSETHWSRTHTLTVLILTVTGAFFMSEFLVETVEEVAQSLEISKAFIGFVVLPMLGNIAEHFVAVLAARKGMTELSLSIAVGSASQVAMIVAPLAVLFGVLTNNPITLNFASLPYSLLIISFVGTFLVIQDGEWYIVEGVMLIALYIAMVVAFAFSQ